MFNFFCNLAVTIYSGTWANYRNSFFVDNFINYMKVCPIFNIFNNSTNIYYATTITGIGGNESQIPPLAITIAVILSTICCISVFFIIVKAVKKLFTCFLDI